LIARLKAANGNVDWAKSYTVTRPESYSFEHKVSSSTISVIVFGSQNTTAGILLGKILVDTSSGTTQTYSSGSWTLTSVTTESIQALYIVDLTTAKMLTKSTSMDVSLVSIDFTAGRISFKKTFPNAQNEDIYLGKFADASKFYILKRVNARFY
jgi:hypothetical protein